MSTGNPQPGEGNAGETKGKEPDMEAFHREVDPLIEMRRIELEEYEKFAEKLREENEHIDDSEIKGLWIDKHGELSDMTELAKVNPEELTRPDAIMWNSSNNYTIGLVTQSQFRAYKANVIHSRNPSRGHFLAVIINKLQPHFWRDEELDRRK